MTKQEFFQSEQYAEEQRVLYKQKGLVYYTPFEELLNSLTHAVGIVFGIVITVLMLLKATCWQSIVAAVLTCFGFVVLYGFSTLYHATTNLKIKRLVRKFDHSSVNFVIISCGISVCMLTSGNVLNYVALGLCYAVAATNITLCFVNLERFKVVSFLSNFVTSLILVVVFAFNREYFDVTDKIMMAVGVLLCIIGATLFGKKKLYIHTVFHLFVLFGPIIFAIITYRNIF